MSNKFDEIRTAMMKDFPKPKTLWTKLKVAILPAETEVTKTIEEPHCTYSVTASMVYIDGVKYFKRWGGLR